MSRDPGSWFQKNIESDNVSEIYRHFKDGTTDQIRQTILGCLSDKGETLLHIAAYYDALQCFVFLHNLCKRAKINIDELKDLKNRTPLMVAKKNDKKNILIDLYFSIQTKESTTEFDASKNTHKKKNPYKFRTVTKGKVDSSTTSNCDPNKNNHELKP